MTQRKSPGRGGTCDAGNGAMTPFERAAAVVVAEIGPSMSSDGRLMRRRWRQRCLNRFAQDAEARALVEKLGCEAFFLFRRAWVGSVDAARRLRREP